MGTGKIERSVALSAAERILTHISPALRQGVVAGSIRREKPVVGDIELVGLPSDRELLVRLLSDIGEAYVIKPGCPDIIPWAAKVDAKYVRLFNTALQCKVDIFLADEDNWGGLLMLRTGSGVDEKGSAFGGFSPGMLQRWKKISGGGCMKNAQLVLPNGRILPQSEESDIFSMLELEWIPPNLRTSQKVIKQFEKRSST